MKQILSTYKILPVLIAPLLFSPIPPTWGNCDTKVTLHDRDKITIDMASISDDGLIGEGSGVKSIDYEFCISATPSALAEVQRIDPTVQCSRSRGRIGCQANQYLCIGSTYQKNWRNVLYQLASLDYVKQIAPSWAD
ncbi:MAG: hypothetical protein DCF20_14390 [Pseudanabaena sp.]|nr:MAG: hypothetical protein DCF20_14390 [Pseudanabaena sp.]